MLMFLCQTFEFRAVQKSVNLVDIEQCRKMKTTYLVAKVGVDTDENEYLQFAVLVVGTRTYHRACTSLMDS